MRTLFVCRGNLCRSRVAEDIFRVLTWKADGRSNHAVRSAGTKAGPGGHQITTQDVEWADVICVMETAQEAHIRTRWPEHASKIRVLGISDIYEPHDETLQTLLTDAVRTLLAVESPGRATVDSTHPRERRRRSGRSRRRKGMLTRRTAGAIAAFVAVAAIAGYRISSRVKPEQPASSAHTSSGPDRSVAPDVAADAGTPAGRDAPSDQTGLPVPVPNRPSRPIPSAARDESPMAARESPNPSSAEVLARSPPLPPVTPPPEPPRAPVARPQPAPLTGVIGAPPAPVDARERNDKSREDVDDPGAIIDWVLREHPARRR
jgi:protein-tyrosine-phosphatase